MPPVRSALLAAALLAFQPVLCAAAPAPDSPTTPAAQSGAEESSGGLQGWGWVLVLAGAATLAASATFALRAQSDQEDWSATADPDRKAQLKDRGESRALAADITGAAGLLTAASGALLVWVF